MEGAVAREGHLLTAGERVALERLVAIDGEARELWARLSLRRGSDARGGGERDAAEAPDRGDGPAIDARGTAERGRVPPVFRVAALRYDLDVTGAIARLAAAGLAHTVVPDERCVGAFDAPALKAACKRLGLPTSGARPALVERLRGRRWVDEPIVMLAHTGLVRRCELLYFQSPYRDRTSLVVERLGNLRWASYTPTGGPGLFRDRAALRAYERARAGAWVDPDEPLRIARAGRPELGLSPWRRAVAAVLSGDPDADTLGALVAAGASVHAQHALRLEREGRAREALAACRAAVEPVTAIALERTGRRLARTLGEGWAPRAPLPSAPVRRLRLAAGASARGRPTWVVDGTASTVEAAVLRLLAAADRRGIHAENWLWTSLYALCFRDLYFLPVPGMLPTARREGPLDVGTPGFYARRRDHVETRLRAIAAEGPARFVDGWMGERLAGLGAGEIVRDLCASIAPNTAAVILGRLAREGWAAARGMPDLYIFSGPKIRIADALPSRVDDRDHLVEIKGPGDALRDEQRVWHAHLLAEGIPVELWEVAGRIL